MAQLIFILVIATAIVWTLSSTGKKSTTESFLVADRNVPLGQGTRSVLANWTQAPALLASGALAYQGPWHFLAFILPNIVALIAMGMFAPKIQEVMPRGYTLPELMGHAFGPGVRTLFFFASFGALSLVIAFTLTGLRLWFNDQLGISPLQIAVILGIFAVGWVLPRGLKGAIVADAVKVAFILAGVAGVVLITAHYATAPPERILSFPPVSPWWVFWSLGVPLSASLIGGPICNPDLAERAFALDYRIVRKAYFWAAGYFALIICLFGSLGFLARHLGLEITGGQLPAFAVLVKTVPQWVVVAATIGLVVILVAALASMLASAGNLIVIEVYRRFIHPSADDAETVWLSRLFMVLPILVGIYIASLPKPDLTVLLQSMGVVRGEVIFPFICALYFSSSIPRTSVFWGMLVGTIGGIALAFGTPVWETMLGTSLPLMEANSKAYGGLFAVFTPLAFCSIGFLSRKPMRRSSESYI